MEKDWFKLSKKNINLLIGYYVTLLIIGLSSTIIILLYNSINFSFEPTISFLSIAGGIGTSLFGCTIFYLRKLYKSCINSEMKAPTSDEDLVREIGVRAYFFLRPVFAIAFSILIYIALQANIHIVAVKETTLSDGFIYMTMFLSFFAGFASGDLINYFESKSAEIVTRIFN